jgi:hypothetical protein
MSMESAALDFRKMMQGGELREMEWAHLQKLRLFSLRGKIRPRVWPVEVRWRVGTSGWSLHRRCFYRCREDGKLRCPAGASLWLSEVRQENAFTRTGRLSRLSD